MTPTPGYVALRRHRWSAAGAEYFVTLAAQRPTTALASDAGVRAVHREIENLGRDGWWSVRCATVMPDHLHLLFALSERGSLSACIRLFKGRLAPVLRVIGAHWQEGFYEHRLRPDEDRLPVFRYIFLNPYRAELVSHDSTWSAFWYSPQDKTWFEPLTRENVPFPEWLR